MVSQAYGCLSCGVHAEFDADQQKNHYKSDWHRYNLRRKINGLPFISKDLFEAKLSSSIAAAESPKKENFYCSVCHKSFGSKNSHENHLRSTRHLEKIAKQPNTVPLGVQDGNLTLVPDKKDRVDEEFEDVEDADDVESNASWETLSNEDLTDDEIEIWSPRCLFCRWPIPKTVLGVKPKQRKATIGSLLRHMQIHHSFFIPQQENVKDMSGLLCHLSCRVHIRCECLWCRMKFQSTRATQQHMNDTGHTKLMHEIGNDIDVLEEEDEEAEVPRHYRYYDLENMKAPIQPQFTDDGWSISLPSGGSIGHRDFNRYYKQHLRAVPLGIHCPVNIARLGYASSEEKRRAVLDFVSMQQNRTGLVKYKPLPHQIPSVIRSDERAHRKQYFNRMLRLGMNNNRIQHSFKTQCGFGWGE